MSERESVATIVEREGDTRFFVSWREDGRWWRCLHQHRSEMAAEACAKRTRQRRTTTGER